MAVFLCGNSPCQMLHCGLALENGSSPQTYFLPSSPPRAANSHSASVGSRLPAHFAYATASSQEAWTTGCSSLPSGIQRIPGGLAGAVLVRVTTAYVVPKAAAARAPRTITLRNREELSA